ncbi:MAG: anaerobic ribonucleoside-triphosphate reductase activating protein [Burkholderiales bacterium]|nr:anaerobic ribonucleoside-triphosphate reductase activating protein [Burkholderiales bacterium]
MRIGGLTPLSATDFPGELAAVVYCQGCPWRCGYCHNPHLLPSEPAAAIAWSEVLEFLSRRRGLLDAVVFSGGEPTAQPGLAQAMRDARALGYRIGLHSAGIYPRRFAEVLPLVDWVGFDAKAPFDAAYARITGVRASGEAALASARLLLASGVDHEFRTTWHAGFLAPGELDRLTRTLQELGARRYVLQEFRASRGVGVLPQGQALAPDLELLSRRFAQFSLRPA